MKHNMETITVDLRTSKIAGMVLDEKREDLIRVLGEPELEYMDKLLYPTKGIAVDLIKDRLAVIYLWVDRQSLHEPFPGGGAEQFNPCNATVISLEGKSIDVTEGITQPEVESVMGKPYIIGPDKNGSFGMDYFGETKTDDINIPLFLRFDFSPSGFIGVWITF
ncbi:MAG: hypothetical protein GY714_26945 [Desulfobacterales bacterium]|nr:hypothetical protein [Desulfobacterales bacterium]